jgi:hypothetical protein
VAALETTGCDVIHAQKRSGTTAEGRQELKIVLNTASPL